MLSARADESTTAPVNVDELKVVLDKLPDLNYRILHYLFNHLRKFVFPFLCVCGGCFL